ncbi:MAG: hypothetical protein IKO72_11310 [Kiritimatiellae bacterium]|nr:hypothetical protein [Kiritimatiellia bacterium]
MKKLLMVLSVSLAALAALANPKGYVMVAAHSPGELPSPAYDINGVRFSLLYGDCQNLNGFDFGFAGRIRERMNGAQIAIGFSIVDSDFNGFELGCVNYVGGEFSGLQLGLWNGTVSGYGTQLGLVNTADYMAGFQCGLFNWANNLDGVQLGLSNVVADRACPWLPFLNIGW